MAVHIHRIALGIDRCYLLQADGIVMVDGGMPNQARRFLGALGSLSIRPRDIRLLVLTHGHWDHVGSARAIKELTGASIALHHREREWLERSLKPLPPGVTAWGRVLGVLMATFRPLIQVPAVEVDIALDDTDVSLADYGIAGDIIHTPGHSRGSVSILLEGGEAFVGDLAMNGFPLRASPGLPILAEDMQQVSESWQVLLDRGAKMIYPAHGEPFAVDVIREALAEYERGRRQGLASARQPRSPRRREGDPGSRPKERQ